MGNKLKNGQAGGEIVDGLVLPEGMKAGRVRCVAHIVHEHERANHYDEDDAPSSVQTAVKIFEAFKKF